VLDSKGPDNSRIPSSFRPAPEINLSEVKAQRTFRFERSGGGWAVNGRIFDANRIDAHVKQNTAEIWTIQNNSGSWSHPVHIHFEEHRILSRNGIAPPTWERGRKDVIRLHPNEEVKIFMRFRDWTGRYPMHCHNTVHEDHAMMIRWELEA
jgi:FtsP/CotA-like multicopper oxidase with cupredoxin domain